MFTFKRQFTAEEKFAMIITLSIYLKYPYDDSDEVDIVPFDEIKRFGISRKQYNQTLALIIGNRYIIPENGKWIINPEYKEAISEDCYLRGRASSI